MEEEKTGTKGSRASRRSRSNSRKSRNHAQTEQKNAGTGVSISKAIGIEADREGDEGAGNNEDVGIDVLDEFSNGGPDDNGLLDGLANGGGGVGMDVLDEFKIDDGGAR